ncbi:hypothetical protein L6R52_29490, partial [Myxococcota bacterium]|nr:hypothetical protein [Myxococcota bacterium]
MTTYAEVAVTLPVDGRFHYAVPPHLEGALEVGHRVLVPFGRRRVTGFVTALTPTVAPEVADKVRPILERMDLAPLVPKDVLALATFTADYYLATVGEVLRLALPPGLTAASKARWVITPAGRHFLDGGSDVLPNGARITTAERRFLEASVRGQGVKLADAPAKVVAVLEGLGLVAKKDTLAAREGGGGEVEVVERVAPGA